MSSTTTASVPIRRGSRAIPPGSTLTIGTLTAVVPGETSDGRRWTPLRVAEAAANLGHQVDWDSRTYRGGRLIVTVTPTTSGETKP
jgi:hypothetical protein